MQLSEHKRFGQRGTAFAGPRRGGISENVRELLLGLAAFLVILFGILDKNHSR